MKLRDFAARMEILGQNVVDNEARLVRRVALAVDSAVVMATPVKTGRARANWIVNIGEATDEVKYPSPSRPGSPEAGANEALTTGQEKIAGHVFGAIHITNNLPYINSLNHGSSIQAPAGFVEKAAQAAKEAIDTAGQLHVNVKTESI